MDADADADVDVDADADEWGSAQLNSAVAQALLFFLTTKPFFPMELGTPGYVLVLRTLLHSTP